MEQPLFYINRVTGYLSGVVIAGIKFTRPYFIGSSSYERTSFLDSDEISGIIKFLDFAKTILASLKESSSQKLQIVNANK